MRRVDMSSRRAQCRGLNGFPGVVGANGFRNLGRRVALGVPVLRDHARFDAADVCIEIFSRAGSDAGIRTSDDRQAVCRRLVRDGGGVRRPGLGDFGLGSIATMGACRGFCRRAASPGDRLGRHLLGRKRRNARRGAGLWSHCTTHSCGASERRHYDGRRLSAPV